MGIMNKVKFWKKDDVFLDDQSGFDSEMSSMNTQPDSLGLETSRDDLMQRTGSVDNPVSFKKDMIMIIMINQHLHLLTKLSLKQTFNQIIKILS